MSKNRVILVGGGNSISEGIELGLWDKIKGEDIWSLNFAYKTMPYPPSAELWIDIHFFTNNIQELQRLYKNGVKCYAKKHSKYSDIYEIDNYTATRDPHLYQGKDSIKKNSIFIGRQGLCGFFALTLAVASNYDEIYLLGYDYGTPSIDNTQTHFYQNKTKELNISSSGVGNTGVYYNSNQRLKSEVEDFEIYLRDKITIYNVSPLSNIPYFPKINYSTFFEIINNGK